MFRIHKWKRDANNPVLRPGPEPFDVGCCMNPFVVREGDTYLLFYAGADSKGQRRICLAEAPVSDPGNWVKRGPIFDLGEPGAFDEFWCVLPCIYQFGDEWHLYYTGRNSRRDEGLQSFTGIGLAVSRDLRSWRRFGREPVLDGGGFSQWPDNRGVAGGGRIHPAGSVDGRPLYRMHYTMPTGRPSADLRIDQEKHSAIVHSHDGISWFDKRIIMSPRPDADYENAATIALNVWPVEGGWRAIYAGIGTRFGAYSICEARSHDGLVWDRGEPDENLSLAPVGEGWESKMTEYPHVVDEGDMLRLFYCGNGYGATGIGMAVAEKLGCG